jgi:diacylglycerol O-acyltransferase
MDRLSALDTFFLHMETDTQPMHVGTLLVLAAPAPSSAELRDHVAAGVARVPALRQRPMAMPLGLGRPVWVDDDTMSLDEHLHHVDLEAPGERAQLGALVARVMERRLAPGRPPWEMWQVDGLADGRWAVVVKAHHSMTDGVSGSGLLLGLLDAASDGAPVALGAAGPLSRRVLALEAVARAATIPYRAGRALARAVRAPEDAVRAVRRVRDGARAVLRPDLPPSVLSGPLGRGRRWGWAGCDLADVRAVTAATGCTVNDVFLAAMSGALRRYLLERGEPLDLLVVRAIVPVSRRSREPSVHGANRVSAMFVQLPLDVAGPAARLDVVRTRTAEQKSREVPLGTGAVVSLADHLPAPLLARAGRAYSRAGQRRVNLIASDVPGPLDAQHLLGRRLLEIAPYVPLGQEIRAGAALVSYAGRLTVGVHADPGGRPPQDRRVDAVASSLRELVDTCRPA